MNTKEFTPEQISKAVEVLKKLKAQKKAFREAVASGNYTAYAKQYGKSTPVPNK
jgi:hypothetical protein